VFDILLFFLTLSKLFPTKYYRIPLNLHHYNDKFLLPTESIFHTGIRIQCKSLLALETEQWHFSILGLQLETHKWNSICLLQYFIVLAAGLFRCCYLIADRTMPDHVTGILSFEAKNDS
jgi:hypothetical protein